MQPTENDGTPTHEEAGMLGVAKPPADPAGGHERLRKSDVLAALERQGHRCNLTGRQLQPETACVDHVIPVVKGGKHTAANIQILHRQANIAKGSMTQAEFIALCREVVAFAGPPPAPAKEQIAA